MSVLPLLPAAADTNSIDYVVQRARDELSRNENAFRHSMDEQRSALVHAYVNQLEQYLLDRGIRVPPSPRLTRTYINNNNNNNNSIHSNNMKPSGGMAAAANTVTTISAKNCSSQRNTHTTNTNNANDPDGSPLSPYLSAAMNVMGCSTADSQRQPSPASVVHFFTTPSDLSVNANTGNNNSIQASGAVQQHRSTSNSNNHVCNSNMSPAAKQSAVADEGASHNRNSNNNNNNNNNPAVAAPRQQASRPPSTLPQRIGNNNNSNNPGGMHTPWNMEDFGPFLSSITDSFTMVLNSNNNNNSSVNNNNNPGGSSINHTNANKNNTNVMAHNNAQYIARASSNTPVQQYRSTTAADPPLGASTVSASASASAVATAGTGRGQQLSSAASSSQQRVVDFTLPSVLPIKVPATAPVGPDPIVGSSPIDTDDINNNYTNLGAQSIVTSLTLNSAARFNFAHVVDDCSASVQDGSPAFAPGPAPPPSFASSSEAVILRDEDDGTPSRKVPAPPLTYQRENAYVRRKMSSEPQPEAAQHGAAASASASASPKEELIQRVRRVLGDAPQAPGEPHIPTQHDSAGHYYSHVNSSTMPGSGSGGRSPLSDTVQPPLSSAVMAGSPLRRPASADAHLLSLYKQQQQQQQQQQETYYSLPQMRPRPQSQLVSSVVATIMNEEYSKNLKTNNAATATNMNDDVPVARAAWRSPSAPLSSDYASPGYGSSSPVELDNKGADMGAARRAEIIRRMLEVCGRKPNPENGS